MNRTDQLSASQRIIAVVFYLGLFLGICKYFNGSLNFITDPSSQYNLLFVSGALLLIFGSYITEPYFTKPVDVITNSVAIILALISIKNPSEFTGYKALLYTSLIMASLSIFLIFLWEIKRLEKVQKFILFWIAQIGRSKFMFSLMYLLTIISYFSDETIEFTFLLTFWVIFISKYVVENIVIEATELFAFFRKHLNQSPIIGEAIGCENPFLYKVEVDFLRHKTSDTKKGSLVYLSLDKNTGAVGIIINEKYMLNKKWATVYLLEHNGGPIKINLKNHEFMSGSKTIFSKDKAVYGLRLGEIIERDSQDLVRNNYLYKNRKNFIGYIAEGSDINKVKFHALLEANHDKYSLLKEGTVVKTEIHNEKVLYQIIDGKTHEEELEKHNIYGFHTGIAKKLGSYNQTNKELEVVKWLPKIYSPVYFDEIGSSNKSPKSIGHLPETKLEIIAKDIDALVTHNTAVLGILGVGKSCLTFELIQKVLNHSDAKVICIDITNEYKNELPLYLKPELIQYDNENVFNSINKRADYIHIEADGAANYEKSGNQAEYKTALVEDLTKFFFEEDSTPESKKFSNTKKIRIFNPDYHKATKGQKVGFRVITSELTQAEKTRIIVEEVFKIMMKLEIDEDKKAKVLIVFEEAHSLVPEWSSAANEGDKSAVNGTAKIILQGRKYGLGSLIVTQRTANISKSILNQCNTIFALRVFDDTGKQFLENYIGSDYSNTLPTLEDRHAIVVGKALKLKQPVIVKLNDKKDVIINHPSKTTGTLKPGELTQISPQTPISPAHKKEKTPTNPNPTDSTNTPG